MKPNELFLETSLEDTIKRLKRATYKRPASCKDCKYCCINSYAEFNDYRCGLIEDQAASSVNYEVERSIEPLACPLPEGEDLERLLTLLSWLEELEEYRKINEKIGSRYAALVELREVFNDIDKSISVFINDIAIKLDDLGLKSEREEA